MTDNLRTDAMPATIDVHTMTTRYLNDLITDGFLHVNSESILDELHGRAIAEDVERGIAHLDTLALGACLEFALLLDVDAPRTAIAVRVLRDRLHGLAFDQWSRDLGLLAEEPVRASHDPGCRCCGAGVAQWR